MSSYFPFKFFFSKPFEEKVKHKCTFQLPPAIKPSSKIYIVDNDQILSINSNGEFEHYLSNVLINKSTIPYISKESHIDFIDTDQETYIVGVYNYTLLLYTLPKRFTTKVLESDIINILSDDNSTNLIIQTHHSINVMNISREVFTKKIVLDSSEKVECIVPCSKFIYSFRSGNTSGDISLYKDSNKITDIAIPFRGDNNTTDFIGVMINNIIYIFLQSKVCCYDIDYNNFMKLYSTPESSNNIKPKLLVYKNLLILRHPTGVIYIFKTFNSSLSTSLELIKKIEYIATDIQINDNILYIRYEEEIHSYELLN